MSALGILQHARSIIASPLNWTTKAAARDINGNWVDVFSPAACSFCSFGALRKAGGKKWNPDFMRAFTVLDAEVGGTFQLFNDVSTHEEVLAMWDRAIANYMLTYKNQVLLRTGKEYQT